MDSFITNLEEAIDGIVSGDLQPETVYEKLARWDSLALL